MIFSTEDIKRQLAKYNKDYTGKYTWQNAFGQIDLSKQAQLSTAEYDYSKAMADAYYASYANSNSIRNSNLGQGYKDMAIAELDLALEQAYDSNRNAYVNAVTEIENAANAATAEIDSALTEQAEYVSRFASAPYEYLQWLFNKYSEGDLQNNIFLTNPLWARYTNASDPTVVSNIVSGFDELKLKSWDELVHTGLFDEQNNLTVEGADFYDQMLNYFDTTSPEKGYGFGQWLATNHDDLFKWSQQYNPYDATDVGTNLGSFKTLVGLTSADYDYSFIERFGGMSTEDIDNLYSGIISKVNDLNTKIENSSGKKAVDTVSEFGAIFDEVKSLTDTLGITDAIENELGMSFDALAKYYSNAAATAKSTDKNFWNAVLTTAAFTGSSAAILGTGTSSWQGAIVGAVIGLIGGIGQSIQDNKNANISNAQLEKSTKESFDNLVHTLVAYSHSMQRQTQGDFYKKNK